MSVQQTLAQGAKNVTLPNASFFEGRAAKRFLILAALMIATLWPGPLGEITRAVLQEAYLAVAVFVVATLFLFYGAERVFKFDFATAIKQAKFAQVPIAAALGALPGCGGSVIVVAAYSSGNVRMGAVVATLTATMGDAAFLLIAKRPDAALILLPLAILAGMITGFLVDRWHKEEFMTQPDAKGPPIIGKTRFKDNLYLAFAIPGLILGVMDLAQMDLEALFGDWVMVFSIIAIFIGMFIWATSPLKTLSAAHDSPTSRSAEETSFITVWVLIAFLIFEYLVAFAGLDIAYWFKAVGWTLPLIAILVGFIPGCGPQILVTTFYINGLIPFGALLANAISNDGDALFPTLAINPRAALLATLYSALPAFLLGYLFWFLAPNFLS